VHGIPTIAFPIAALLIIATLALVIGGSAVGWNIAAALTSSTAILIYAVLCVLLIALIYYYLTHR
jgi:sterol desaturase/sphingolipid hydroxylase (fatty acid hydroxylase superfamily)